MIGNWVYIRSESQLWTVGFYGPDGRWNTDSDWDNKEQAGQRVHYLNGGDVVPAWIEDPTAAVAR